jgi:hypothetical protein
MKKIIKNSFFKKLIIVGLFLFFIAISSGYYFIAKAFSPGVASGSRVFAGEIVWVMPDCSEPLTCSARCPICGCGPWSQIHIAPTFGRTPQSSDIACPAYVFRPFGNANLTIGSVIFGYSSSDWLIVNGTPSTNIWSVFQ